MPADLDEIDAAAWKAMAFALQRAVLDQFKMIEDLRAEMVTQKQVTQHMAQRYDLMARDLNDIKLGRSESRLRQREMHEFQRNITRDPPFVDASGLVYDMPRDTYWQPHRAADVHKMKVLSEQEIRKAYSMLGVTQLPELIQPDPVQMSSYGAPKMPKPRTTKKKKPTINDDNNPF